MSQPLTRHWPQHFPLWSLRLGLPDSDEQLEERNIFSPVKTKVLNEVEQIRRLVLHWLPHHLITNNTLLSTSDTEKRDSKKTFQIQKISSFRGECWNLLEVVLMNNAFGYLGHSVRCKHAVWLVVWSGDERVLTLREQYCRQIVLGGEYWGGVVMNNVGPAPSHARPGMRSFVRMWNNVDQDAFSQLQQQ